MSDAASLRPRRPCRGILDVPHVRELLIRLSDVVPISERRWNARCPACRQRALGVELRENNSLHVACSAGCQQPLILSAMRLDGDALRPQIVGGGQA
jgi:hypothetical protein